MKYPPIKDSYFRIIVGLVLSILFLPLKAEELSLEQLYTQYTQASGDTRSEVAERLLVASSYLYDTAYHCNTKTEPQYLNALVLDVMSNYYYDIGDYEQAVVYVRRCLEIPQVRDSSYLYEDIISLASITYFRLSEFPEAVKYAEESIRLSRETGIAANVSSALNNIAGILLAAGQPEEAEHYILESLEVERTLDRPRAMAVRLGIASEVFLKSGKLEQALIYGREALEVEPEPAKKGIRQSQLAAVLMELKRYEEAYPMLLEAKESLEQSSNVNSLSIVLGQLARIAIHRGSNKEAVDYLEQSLAICKQTGNLMLESKNCYMLYQTLHDSRPQSAMEYLERYAKLNDDMFNEKLAEQLQSFNVKYKNAETQHQLDIQEEQLRRQQLWGVFIIGLLILLIIVSVLLARLLKSQHRNNKMLKQASIAKDELLRIANEEKLQAETARRQILEVADHISSLGEIEDAELTRRELQIIQLYSRGLMSKEVADQLNISVRTVETHKAHIYRKLGISTSVELLRFAEQKGLIVQKNKE